MASEGVFMGLIIFMGYLFVLIAGAAGCGLLLRGLGVIPGTIISVDQVGLLWGVLIVGHIVGFLILLGTGQLVVPHSGSTA